jgi:hypothetical protein
MKSRIEELMGGGTVSASDQFDDEDVEVRPLKGLKLSNNNSSVKRPPPKLDIQANASKILASQEVQSKLGWELTTKLLAVFKDKTLKENKDSLYIDAETGVLKDYVDFARLINSDEHQEEGLGTLGFSIAIVKCALLQRDRLNEVEYELSLLKKELNQIKVELKTNADNK